MQKIFYRDDFVLCVRMLDPMGRMMIPSEDFTIILRAGRYELRAGRRGGRLYGCRESELRAGELEIVCDNHNFPPTSELEATIVYYLPDSKMPDWTRSQTRRYKTGVELCADSQCCIPSAAEFEALLPYIKGEKGDRGEKGEQGKKGEQGPQGERGEQGPAGESARWSDLTDEERAEFRDAILAEIGYELVATEEDIERMWEEIEKENGD